MKRWEEVTEVFTKKSLATIKGNFQNFKKGRVHFGNFIKDKALLPLKMPWREHSFSCPEIPLKPSILSSLLLLLFLLLLLLLFDKF